MNKMENDSKFLKTLGKYLIGPLGKLAQLKIVRGIMGAGIAAIPFTIVGSMFLVLNILPETFPILEGFFDATFLRFSDLFMVANSTTMGLLALYFNLALGYEYTKIIAQDEDLNMSGLNGALLSMFAFFMTIPQLIFEDGMMSLVNNVTEDVAIFNGWEIGPGGVERLSTTGIFTGIIMAVLAVNLYKLCVKRNWIIQLPDEVPAGVSRAFTALIPAFIVAFAVIIINGVLVAFNTDIFQIIETPFGFVTELTSTLGGVLVIVFLVHALWLVGIHGANIIGPLIAPIGLANLAANAAGANIPFAGEFTRAFAEIGGSGGTLILTFFIAYRAKSEQLKAIGKVSMGPAIFNINEPLIFGLPIIFNPFLAIPFFLAPMVSVTIAYLAISWEIIPAIIAQMPWPTPVGLGAFISTGGSLGAAVLSIITALIGFLIYYPFIKAYDKKLVAQEQTDAESVADVV